MTFEEKGIIIPNYINSGQYYTVVGERGLPVALKGDE